MLACAVLVPNRLAMWDADSVGFWLSTLGFDDALIASIMKVLTDGSAILRVSTLSLDELESVFSRVGITEVRPLTRCIAALVKAQRIALIPSPLTSVEILTGLVERASGPYHHHPITPAIAVCIDVIAMCIDCHGNGLMCRCGVRSSYVRNSSLFHFECDVTRDSCSQAHAMTYSAQGNWLRHVCDCVIYGHRPPNGYVQVMFIIPMHGNTLFPYACHHDGTCTCAHHGLVSCAMMPQHGQSCMLVPPFVIYIQDIL